MATAAHAETKWWGGGRSPFNVEYGKLMMWYFLMSDTFTFGAFLISYGTIRFSQNYWPDPNHVFNAFPFAVTRLSSFKVGDPLPKVMIVDSIGLLAYLYSLGKIAYVGGGFGAGIHNTLEPMAHGKPLIFGPTFGKFPEAVTMTKEKAAISINTTDELIKALNHFNQSDNAERAGGIVYRYLVEHRGASDQVVNYIVGSILNEQKA